MNTTPDFWQIRFGQWFEAALQVGGRELRDVFYFWPQGLHADTHAESGYLKIDLRSNSQAYQTHFNRSLTIPPLSEITAEWKATLVLVPSVGHHVLKNKVLQDQLAWLEAQGLKVLYGFYDDSFKSVSKCARSLYDTIKNADMSDAELVFLGYSKGASVAMELLADDSYQDVRKQTLALVSLAGTIRGTPAASTAAAKVALLLLKSYKRYSSRTVRKLLRFAGRLTGWTSSWFSRTLGREWREMQADLLEFEDEITDLPEGLLELTPHRSEDRVRAVTIDPSIGLFSLSAAIPPSTLKEDARRNPDDFFLYWASRDLYSNSIFCDTQVVLPYSRFYPSNGSVHDLGVLRGDHWGIALEYVISQKYKDPFPRREMLWALWATLWEFTQGNLRAPPA